MGTKLALALATLSLQYVEQDYLASAAVRPRLYFTYIDDIFVVWEGYQDSLIQLVDRLNLLKPRLKFTATVDHHSIQFLDQVIYNSRIPNLTLQGKCPLGFITN